MSDRTNLSAQPTYQEREQEHERDREEIAPTMNIDELRAKHPDWEIRVGRDIGATLRVEGETLESALTELAVELDRRDTAARHARIGELVERIVASTEHIPDDGRLFIGHRGQSVGIEDDFGEHRHVASDSLLAALEALAKEIGGDDE